MGHVKPQIDSTRHTTVGKTQKGCNKLNAVGPSKKGGVLQLIHRISKEPPTREYPKACALAFLQTQLRNLQHGSAPDQSKGTTVNENRVPRGEKTILQPYRAVKKPLKRNPKARAKQVRNRAVC